MTDIVERLRGSPHTRCLDPMCFEGHQVCPHDEEEILEAEELLMEEAAKEIERLRADNARLRAALEDAYPFIVVAVNQYKLDFELDRLHDTHADIADRIARLLGKDRIPSEVLDNARRALEAKHD